MGDRHFDIENLEASIDEMIESTDRIVARHKAWTPLQQARAGIVAWEYGLDDVYRFILLSASHLFTFIILAKKISIF